MWWGRWMCLTISHSIISIQSGGGNQVCSTGWSFPIIWLSSIWVHLSPIALTYLLLSRKLLTMCVILWFWVPTKPICTRGGCSYWCSQTAAIPNGVPDLPSSPSLCRPIPRFPLSSVLNPCSMLLCPCLSLLPVRCEPKAPHHRASTLLRPPLSGSHGKSVGSFQKMSRFQKA